ncbi:MAG: SIS domain-containing protein [Alistipes sp.]|nr:SIS domain-containing protein [Alistipes sp.]
MQQPAMWLKEYELLLENKTRIAAFVSKYLDQGYQVIYTGAGTSAYIGDVLEFALKGTSFCGGAAVPTTDIITHPGAWLQPDKKVLLVSFARSGNSPESLGAIRIANSICKNIAHIYITCNAEGELARTAGADNTLLLLLPAETNDKSLAMTSSFSTMLLTGMLVADIANIESKRSQIEALAANAEKILAAADGLVPAIAARTFSRAVFLGFRHGPKAVINENSLLVYLFSEDPAVRRYETDLVAQINANNKVVAQIAVSAGSVEVPGVKFDLEAHVGTGNGIYGCIP